ncbi:MAG: hypothetical protein QOI78_7634 [Actinomycetota bacterium]|nr:hypothetical protein [Actinomycetota bacterium]
MQPFGARVIVPLMGKHSRRKSGYLPRVAAGAAPVALFFAAPVSAFAAQSDLTLPLDGISLPVGHRHAGTLDVEPIYAGRRDVVTKQLGDVRVASDLAEAAGVGPAGASAARLGRHDLRVGQVAVTTGNEQRLAGTSTPTRLGTGESTHHGVLLGNGVDVLSENAEQVDSGLFTGDLTGGIAARRSSGQAVDLGRLGAVGTSSEQHVTGRLSGVLDVGQKHELGGQLGPASGLVKASQSLQSGSISGDLGVDRVVHVQGRATSVRGTLDPSASASVLDQPVL